MGTRLVTANALDVAWTDADGIQRPANWLRLSMSVTACCTHG